MIARLAAAAPRAGAGPLFQPEQGLGRLGFAGLVVEISAKLVGELVGGREPVDGAFLEAFEADCLELRTDRLVEFAGPDRLVVNNLAQDDDWIVSGEKGAGKRVNNVDPRP